MTACNKCGAIFQEARVMMLKGKPWSFNCPSCGRKLDQCHAGKMYKNGKPVE
nr:hypothetical protein [Candidatus Sigynarchaeum springense]